MRLLIDTNVVLDALMNREPWSEQAHEVILAAAEEKAEGCVSASAFTDIHYILSKYLRSKDDVMTALIGLLRILTVLDVSGSDCEKAYDLPMPDYEDALLASCGKRHKVDYIVTRNKRHYKGSPVKAVEPGEILSMLS